MRKLAILGSTGSIGRQTLDIVREHPDDFQLVALSCLSNTQLLFQQIQEFRPANVCVGKPNHHLNKRLLTAVPCQYFEGDTGLLEMIEACQADIYVVAIVGFAALKPMLYLATTGKTIALANKESLVVAGQHITDIAKNHNTRIYPIDSEHSAIFQSIQGEHKDSIDKLILTASGGPFRTFSKQQLENVTLKQAMKHPNWKMGEKITVDSATMMNKGFEVIEARWLFDIPLQKIQVVVHPQSIVHSAVQFCDGAVKAQLGLPDMHLPIQYALYYPQRKPLNQPPLQWDNVQLDFYHPDTTRFPCLSLAYEAIRKGGNAPCILNVSNDYANDLFRHNQCRFLDIPKIIEQSLNKIPFIPSPTIEDLFQTQSETMAILVDP